ncbi:MAG: DNA methyltransferase [Candidatus Bipolaricaulis sp.]|nr:DNA methyltransferase [Candidatus Bipolaricaulis sp.]
MVEWKNKLYFGDNLKILRAGLIASESVDLIYLDPPFNSKASYNVLFKTAAGTPSTSQVEAFRDTWEWGEEARQDYLHVISSGPPRVAALLESFFGNEEKRLPAILGTRSPMMAYICMMAARLLELRRVLKPEGSIYLHCDPTASHYLKLVMDAIFGPEMFQNEIVWKRTTAHNDPKRYGRIGDRILFYSKSKAKTFNRPPGEYSDEQLARYKYEDENGKFRAENLTAPHFSPTRTVVWRGTHPGADRQWRFDIDKLEELYAAGRILLRRDGCPRKDGLKEYLDDAKGPAPQDIWTDISLPPTAAERTGYDTQKPIALLERIILASSNEGDLVLDPFCGCGTAAIAAQRNNRRWIGIDVSYPAIVTIKSSLRKEFPGGIDIEEYGTPKTAEDAKAIAASGPDGRYLFEWCMVDLLSAFPANDRRKGPDRGVDGLLPFVEDTRGHSKRILIQTKSGKTQRDVIATLKGDMAEQGADIGVLMTVEPPTKPMQQAADSAGFYVSPLKPSKPVRRVQIITVDEFFAGKRIEYYSLKDVSRTATEWHVPDAPTTELPLLANVELEKKRHRGRR